jgi:hypothetical protein
MQAANAVSTHHTSPTDHSPRTASAVRGVLLFNIGNSTMIDIDHAKYEATRTLGVVLPASMADAIEQRAKAELTAKSAWMRRIILAELNRGAASASPPSKGAKQ